MKTILIVGGAGYVGSHVAKLIQHEFNLIILDNLSGGFLENVKNFENTTFIEGDLGDKDLLRSIFQKYPIEAVLNFGAFLKVGESVDEPAKYYQNNLIKAYNLLNIMLEFECKVFIFSSTAAVYGNPSYLPIDLNHPTNPINPYGNTKLALERLVMDYHKAYGLEYGVLRYFNVNGSSDDETLGDRKYPALHLIPICLFKLIEKQPIEIFGDDYETPDGTCIRDYIHIEDLAEAQKASLKHLLDKKPSHILNLGTGKGYSVKEIVNLAFKISRKTSSINIIPRRKGDPAKLYTDYEGAKKLLGWSPKHDIESIVESSWRWICSLKKN